MTYLCLEQVMTGPRPLSCDTYYSARVEMMAIIIGALISTSYSVKVDLPLLQSMPLESYRFRLGMVQI